MAVKARSGSLSVVENSGPAAAPASSRAAWGALAAMIAATAGWLVYLTRGTTFHYDEWNFVVNRRGHGLDTFFEPHNEHISALPVFVFKTLFEVVGLTPYWPYQLMPIAVHLLCALLVYLLARPRLGEWWAIAPAALVLVFGAAWEDILWPFQIGYLIPVAAFLAALVLLGRNTLAADVAAALLVAAGLASSSFGVPMALGVAAYLIVARARVLRLVGVTVVPLLLYLAWNQEYGVTKVTWSQVPDVPRLAADLIAATLAALFGLSSQFGPALALVLVAAAALHVLRSRPVSPVLAGAAVGALASFASLALFRPGILGSRYYYPGGVLLVLVLVELAPADLPRRVRARTLAVLAVAAAFVLFGQVSQFLDGGKFFRDWARFTSTSMGALEIARDHVDPEFRPDPVRAPDVNAGKYWDVTGDWGSPADSPQEILDRPEDARQNADSVLAAALALELRPASRPPEGSAPPRSAPPAGGTTEQRGGCLILRPEGQRAAVEVRLPPGGVWLRPERGANAEVRLRRFGAGYPFGDVPPGRDLFAPYVQAGSREFIGVPVLRAPDATGSSLTPPGDRAPGVPWHGQVAADAPVEICTLGV